MQIGSWQGQKGTGWSLRQKEVSEGTAGQGREASESLERETSLAKSHPRTPEEGLVVMTFIDSHVSLYPRLKLNPIPGSRQLCGP